MSNKLTAQQRLSRIIGGARVKNIWRGSHGNAGARHWSWTGEFWQDDIGGEACMATAVELWRCAANGMLELLDASPAATATYMARQLLDTLYCGGTIQRAGHETFTREYGIIEKCVEGGDCIQLRSEATDRLLRDIVDHPERFTVLGDALVPAAEAKPEFVPTHEMWDTACKEWLPVAKHSEGVWVSAKGGKYIENERWKVRPLKPEPEAEDLVTCPTCKTQEKLCLSGLCRHCLHDYCPSRRTGEVLPSAPDRNADPIPGEHSKNPPGFATPVVGVDHQAVDAQLEAQAEQLWDCVLKSRAQHGLHTLGRFAPHTTIRRVALDLAVEARRMYGEESEDLQEEVNRLRTELQQVRRELSDAYKCGPRRVHPEFDRW